MLKQLLSLIAALKKVSKAGDALDDDLNKNNIPEYLDIKQELIDIKPVLIDLVERGKRILGLATALAAHVIEAI